MKLKNNLLIFNSKSKDISLSFSGTSSAISLNPVADIFFDLIVPFDVLEHISDDSKAIKEMFRVLRKNGRLFLETPNRERLSYWILILIGRKRKYPLTLAEDCVHLREYTKCELEEKFKKIVFGK